MLVGVAAKFGKWVFEVFGDEAFGLEVSCAWFSRGVWLVTSHGLRWKMRKWAAILCALSVVGLNAVLVWNAVG